MPCGIIIIFNPNRSHYLSPELIKTLLKTQMQLSTQIFTVPKKVTIIILLLTAISYLYFMETYQPQSYHENRLIIIPSPDSNRNNQADKTIDTALYNTILMKLVHGKPARGWPVKSPYPLAGAILPFNRIVAYYGNFYAHGMGILGEFSEAEMLLRLKAEVRKWQQADTEIPVLPAIHYIAVTAQDHPGKDHKYRLRMPSQEIEKAIRLAEEVNGIVFLDIQVGLSTLEEELPLLEQYLKLPNVHLGIDPEYSMKGGQVPCTVIGTFDAADINYASNFLKSLVNKYRIIPKILVVHRFTQAMVTHYKSIVTYPEVQIVMHMDGFGNAAKKIDSYNGFIMKEPVQFAGFKLFYHFDIGHGQKNVMQPKEILALHPSPVYIQYQ